jgi:tetratricopeptide (TPR) repeat protein
MKIEELVIRLSEDPFNPQYNFDCAVEYERINQTASAVSFYLRAAEYGVNQQPLIVYASLLKMAHCFEDQKDRTHTVTNCLLQAIDVIPNRPEAYFLLSQYYERQGNWQECYTWAKVGLFHLDVHVPLPTDVGYPGSYCLEFEQAVSAWWIGRKEESKRLFSILLNERKVTTQYEQVIKSNIKMIEDKDASV